MLKIWSTSKTTVPLIKVLKPVLIATGTDHKFISSHTQAATELESSEKDVWVFLGGKGLDYLKQFSSVPKKATLASCRGKPFAVALGPNGSIVPAFVTYDPVIVEMDSGRQPDIVWDMRLACRLHDTGSLKPQIGSYRWVEHFGCAINCIQTFIENGEKPQVSLDLETIGLDPFAEGVRIVTVSLTYINGESDVYRVPKSGVIPEEVVKQLEWLCTCKNIRMVGANLKFDILWLREHVGFWVTNQTLDTNIVGSMTDENRSNSLNLHAKIYTTMGGYDDEFNASHDKSRMDVALEEDPEGFLTYAGGDTDACYRVADCMRAELKHDKVLTNFYTRLLQPASLAFAKMEHRGVLVDQNRYKELAGQVQGELDRLEKEIFSLIPRRIRLKYSDDLKLSRPVILREFLFTERGLNLTPVMFTEKENKPSTAIEHLEMFRDTCPEAEMFVDLMGEYNSASKTMSTYITGFQKHIRADGKFHPSYMMFKGDYGGKDSGTVTGRTSAKDPAYQTIPCESTTFGVYTAA